MDSVTKDRRYIPKEMQRRLDKRRVHFLQVVLPTGPGALCGKIAKRHAILVNFSEKKVTCVKCRAILFPQRGNSSSAAKSSSVSSDSGM